jgi:hypothetical protein
MLAWSHPGVAAQKLRVALEAIARVEADETTSFSVDCLQEPEALRAA